MKTSNKILLGLLVVIFAIPFLLAFSLKRKVKNGEYTTVKNEDRESEDKVRSGSFTAFKVVKVIAPGPNFLTCHLKLSENMSYRYYQRPGEDSIAVFTGNDTLFVTYVTRKDQRDNNLQININLLSFNNLVVDGAVVVIDSLPASPVNLTVTLKNNGQIKDGSEKKKEPVVKGSPPVSIQKEKMVKEKELYGDVVKAGIGRRKFMSIPNAGLEIFSMTIKNILIFHFI
ncbi:MAG: hypothetical protein ABIN89_25980 [Chitinophagaceae bacterium]